MGRDPGSVRSDALPATRGTRPPDLTRRRKMPHDLLVESVVARKGRTPPPGVRDLAREAHMAGPTGVSGCPGAGEGPGPEALLGLARHHAAGACADGDWRTHGGMLLVAIDGPASDVPTDAGTIARRDGPSGHGRDRATTGLSGASGVVDRQMPGLAVRRGGLDERAEVPGYAGAVADAVGGLPFALATGGGHPSLPLMAALSDMGVPYVMRCQRNFMNAGSGACEAAGGDPRSGPGPANSRPRSAGRSDRDAWGRLAGHAPLRVRCAPAGAGGEAPERPAAAIGDDVLATNGPAEACHTGWGAGTCLRFTRDRPRTGSLAGTGPRLTGQDACAAAHLANVASGLANEAEREAPGDIAARGHGHRTAASRTVAIGVPRDEPAGAVLAGDAAVREAMMSDIVAELGRCLVPVRPARACDRDGPGGKRANRHGDTHKRAFWRPQVPGKRPQVARHALRAKAAQTVMSGRPTSGALPM